MKYIAFYLPQFHSIPENDEMWGKGFTDWDNVKRAKPLFDGHYQPVEPMNDFYYNLADANNVMRWQVKLAKEYGIYGFCFYHYWYNGKKIMEKPIDAFLEDTSLELPFCICWANHDWIMTWGDKKGDILYKQDYSDRTDWKAHFDYLLPFFKDQRYIKNDGKPLVVLYDALQNDDMNMMLDSWVEWAKEVGLPGLSFAYEGVNADITKGFDDSRYTYDIEYQPLYARVMGVQKNRTAVSSMLHYINNHTFKLDLYQFTKKLKKDKLMVLDYDDLWNRILAMKPVSKKSIPGVFVNVDTTPRKQLRGMVSQGMTPQKLKEYLIRQIKKTKEEYKTDMAFIFAWNEWAEGAYMEPDKRWGYQILEAFRDALLESSEYEP